LRVGRLANTEATGGLWVNDQGTHGISPCELPSNEWPNTTLRGNTPEMAKLHRERIHFSGSGTL
jgi:hypothetical protein